ncbi:MAG: helix-turn-helix transcriptional regulator [Peptococcaceae bacterium]|nr:helix-turn-helix transcriptional regulator [Peptococcaceae bacterium]
MKNRKVINIQVGKAIKDLREAAGLTQEQFAELISMSTKNVSSVERGRVGISLSTLKHICEKLNVSSDRILFGDRYTNNVDLLSERFSLLSPEEFATVSDVFNKLFIATAMHRK